ncbi:MAG: long-chain-fatty-acid--CoA ligase [Betaproteobacteria bacterium RIFCSPLOWO2_12_FULL_65_14]|nr:MAG: long-chain-fatty-acid--CoA ligase [Betaproteobacteria bacterium RIFCSPLOWO2_12_FULL_65_14]
MANEKHPPDTLKALFEASFARYGARPAFASMGVTLSYGEVDELSAAFGAFLRRGLALAPGDRVAIMLPNLLQYPVALIGALRSGIAVVNVNPLYTAAELQYQLADSGAAAVVVLENFAHTLEQALAGTRVRHVVTTQVGDLFPAAKRWAANFVVKRVKHMVPAWHLPGALAWREALAHPSRLAEVFVQPGDIAFLQYTGGTTGRPKGAVLTHANVAANVAQTVEWIGGTLAEGEETVITALPLYHIFALTANLLAFMRLGGRNVLIANPRELAALVSELKRIRFSAITGVNTLYRALLDQPGFAALDFSGLKLAIAGGMTLQREVAERWQRATGVPLIECYGLTEASPNVCVNPVDAREFSGKLGLPLPSTEVTIRDEQGAELARGEVGEICVRGPQVMRGYWNAPEETAQAFFPGAWLRTGDLGRMDAAGYAEFVERRKDVIVVSGFKAYPSEIEQVALLHPGVKDAGAAGVPDARSGEAVALYVVRRDPQLSAEALAEHCAKYLAPYKRPKRIEFRDSLPKSPLGKVLHRELQAAATTPGARRAATR